MKPRTIAEIVGAVAIILLLALSRCEGKNAGIYQEQLKTAQHEAKQHDKAASIYKDSLAREKKRGDSLEKRKAVTVTKYRAIRDTLTLTDTVEVKVALDLADSVIAQQDTLILSLKRQVLLGDHALSERESQIQFLNKQISIQAKQIRNAKLNGWLKTVGAFGGGYILGKATKP